MSQQNAAQLLKTIKQNEVLRERFQAVSDPDTFIKLAAEHGYHFTEEDLKTELGKLSDEEFASVVNPGIRPRLHIFPK